jgi:ATP-dependent Clp protease ATP-binding subunit ClpA
VFEKFTEKGIKVIMLAQEESKRLGHNFVGTEHILIGLIGEGAGIAAKALKSAGANLKNARIEEEKIIGRGSGYVPADIAFTPRAKRVLVYSLEESRQLNDKEVSTEHLLLGILKEGEGVAARILENLGIDSSKLKESILKEIELRVGQTPPKPADLNPIATTSPKFQIETLLKAIIRTMRGAKELANGIGNTQLGEALERHEAELTKELKEIGFFAG